MKRIELKNFSPPEKQSVYTKEKMYRVYLGNSHMYHFTAEFKVKKFLSETTNLLNDSLYIINELYSHTFKEFREYWFDADPHTEMRISKMFQTIDVTFSRTVRKSHEINIFAFRNMFLIIQELVEINNIMIEFYTKKNDKSRVTKLKFIQEQLNYVKLKLENWNLKNDTELENL